MQRLLADTSCVLRTAGSPAQRPVSSQVVGNTISIFLCWYRLQRVFTTGRCRLGPMAPATVRQLQPRVQCALRAVGLQLHRNQQLPGMVERCHLEDLAWVAVEAKGLS